MSFSDGIILAPAVNITNLISRHGESDIKHRYLQSPTGASVLRLAHARSTSKTEVIFANLLKYTLTVLYRPPWGTYLSYIHIIQRKWLVKLLLTLHVVKFYLV